MVTTKRPLEEKALHGEEGDETLSSVPSRSSRRGSEIAAGLRPERRTSGLTEKVAAQIRQDILSHKIPPGSRISVDSLARELGVSQTPVREALSTLEALGLVTKRYLSGYCCSPKLGRRQFENLHEMRMLLEPYVARLAATRISDEGLTALRAMLRRMEPDKLGETRTGYQRFADQDSTFHATIAAASGNDLAAAALARLHTHLHIFRLRFHSEVTNHAFDEHQLILQVLLSRSPSAAEGAMREHIQCSYERLIRFTAEEPA